VGGVAAPPGDDSVEQDRGQIAPRVVTSKTSVPRRRDGASPITFAAGFCLASEQKDRRKPAPAHRRAAWDAPEPKGLCCKDVAIRGVSPNGEAASLEVADPEQLDAQLVFLAKEGEWPGELRLLSCLMSVGRCVVPARRSVLVRGTACASATSPPISRPMPVNGAARSGRPHCHRAHRGSAMSAAADLGAISIEP